MTNRFGLEGKAALVLGGGQGIGEAACLALAEENCRVAVADLQAARAEAVCESIRQTGGTALPFVGNVLDESEVGALVDQAWDAFRGLDILITIVGSSDPKPIVETTAEIWDAEQNINLRYCFLAAKAFAIRKIRQGAPGAITFVSSGSGIAPAMRHAAYGAAKAGLIHLTKSMALEWGAHEIRVNSVAPGPIATPRLPDSDAWREAIEQSPMPLKRRGTVDDIANALLFLSSDMANYITGQTLSVDGGVTVGNLLPFPKSFTERKG